MARTVVYIADCQAEDPGQLGSLLGALSELGTLTEYFSDWSAGLRRASSGAADLVVIDLDAPSLGGLELQLQIGRVASRIPVLVLSAQNSKARRMWAVGAGVVGYVTKPVDGKSLQRFITKVLKAS